MKIITIVAIDKKAGIGKNNRIPWKQRDDLRTFREITDNSCVVMGRKTFESIGKPLPNRINVILTNDSTYKHDGIIIATMVSEVLDFTKKNNVDFLYVCGGYRIYRAFMPLTDIMFITFVDADANCDVFFPLTINDIYNNWKEEISSNKEADKYNQYDTKTVMFSRGES